MFIDHSEMITKQKLQPWSENTSIREIPESHQISASPELQNQSAIKAQRIHSVSASPAEVQQKPVKVLGMKKDDPGAYWCMMGH